MLTWQGIEPDYVKNVDRVAFRKSRDALAKSYSKKMQGIFRKAKTVGVAGVEHDLRTAVDNVFLQSRKLGFSAMGRAGAWDKFDISTIKAAAEEEMKHARKFLDDYIKDRGKMPYAERFDQYQNTVQHQFNMAAYQSAPHGTLIFWEMSSFEPCEDCPELAARSPYTTDLGNKPLPTVPQAGDTECLGACKCYLRYEFKPFPVGTEPHMSYEVDMFDGSPVDLKWIKSKQGQLVQRDLNRMYRRTAHHRQMMEAFPHDSKMWHHHRKLRDTWNGKIVDYKNKYGIRGVPRANVSDYLKPIDVLMRRGSELLMPGADYVGPGAIARGVNLTPGKIIKVDKTSVRMEMADGSVKTLTFGDEAGASLWKIEPLASPAPSSYIPSHFKQKTHYIKFKKGWRDLQQHKWMPTDFIPPGYTGGDSVSMYQVKRALQKGIKPTAVPTKVVAPKRYPVSRTPRALPTKPARVYTRDDLHDFAKRVTVKNGTATADDIRDIYRTMQSVEKEIGIFSRGRKIDSLIIDYTKNSKMSGGYMARFPGAVKRDKIYIYPNSAKRLTVKSAERYQRAHREAYVVHPSKLSGVEVTTRHELGHFWDRLLHQHTESFVDDFLKVWKDAQKTLGTRGISRGVSQYASTKQVEFFAESFTKYSAAGYQRGTLPKIIEKFFDDALKKWRAPSTRIRIPVSRAT